MSIEIVMAKMAQISEIQRELDSKTHRLEYELLELVGVVVDVSPPDLSLGWQWPCPTSPTTRCVYNDNDDPAHDQCLICGDPEERK